ncbi:aldo/keto reductase family protein [Campylobacterota bacterium DY0563]
MEYKLSTNNIKVPKMIYGTAWKKEKTALLVKEAILNGFRGIDTACQPRHYQEDLVGDGIQEAYKEGIKREDLYIQTKFTPIDGQDKNNMPYLESDSISLQVEKSFETSKKNLKTDYIDTYILHSPVFPGSKLLNVWNTMSSFQKNKEVGQLGISNCYDLDVLKYLYEKVEIKPAIVQNRFYAQTSYDKTIRQWCQEKGIIYESFWSLTANPEILNSELIFALSRKYKKTNVSIFYRFLNQIGIIPLNGTTTKEHMIEDLKIFEFSLEEEDIKKILELLK